MAASRSVPSPPLIGLLGRAFGHLPELMAIAKKTNKSVSTVLYEIRPHYYKVTNSKYFMLNFAGKKTIFCADPAVYKEVLGPKQESFTNGVQFKKVFGHFFPTAMIVVDGEQWQRVRKIVQRAIGKQSLDPIVGIVCETTGKLLNRPDKNQIQTATMMERMTFDAFHRLMYGWDPQSTMDAKESVELINACNVIGRAIAQRISLPIPWLWSLPTQENRKIDSACRFIRDFVVNFVAERRKAMRQQLAGASAASAANVGRGDSLLDAMILAAESGEDGGMSDAELHDQIAILFFGAYDTTSGTLLHMLNFLARHPAVQDRLRAALAARFPRGVADLERAAAADLDAVPYLNHFVDEVHRLHAIAPFFSRTCIRDTEVAGIPLAADTEILIDSSAAGRDPSLWGGQTDLDQFRPERWAEFAAPPRVVSQLAFGFGGRICPGRRIALSEMKALVSAILLGHRIRLRRADEPVELELVIGLGLRAGTGNVDFEALATGELDRARAAALADPLLTAATARAAE